MNPRTPARHRSRASAACLACRKARIRCVTNHPHNACINCKDNSYECRFDARDGRKERASAKAVTESLTKRVHQLEELLRATKPVCIPRETYMDSLDSAMTDQTRLDDAADAAAVEALSMPDYRQHSSSVPLLDDSGTTTAAEAYYEAYAVEDKTNYDGGNSIHADASEAPDSTPSAAATAATTSSVVRSLVPSPIRFDMSTGRVRYFGPTTNMNVLTHIPPDADTDTEDGRRRPDRRPEAHWPVCLVVRDLSPDTHDYLMDQYWTCYNAVLHLVHSDAFNHDLERGGTQFYSLFLHLAMLATGFRFADKTRPDVQRLAAATGSGRFGSTLHERAVALAKREFDRPGGIPSIQAFGLLADVEFNTGRDESGWLFAGVSLRLVTDVGLHVDPGPLRLTVKEAQIRHMVLWACMLHDMYWSLYLGRPTTLKPADIAPACLAKDFTRLIGCRPSGHEKKLTTRIYEHLLRLMDLARPLCDRSTLARPAPAAAAAARTTETYFKMVALDEDLRAWHDNLPADLRWPTTRTGMPSSYYLLHTQYHAALILLHRPFVQYQHQHQDGAATAGEGDDPAAAAAAAAVALEGGGHRARFTDLSRAVCAEHAGHIVALFEAYRACPGLDVSRVFGTGLAHLGTAATTLMGEAVLETARPDRRGAVVAQLLSVRRSIRLMAGNYPPAHHMTRILDEFIRAVRHQDDPPPLLPDLLRARQTPRPPRAANPCTFTPTVPASPSLQGLPCVPSSFLASLDASDLVVFPETAGYSDYGFDWDPADMTPI